MGVTVTRTLSRVVDRVEAYIFNMGVQSGYGTALVRVRFFINPLPIVGRSVGIVALAKNFSNVRFLRTSWAHTVMAAAQLSAMRSQRRKVRQHQRGAAEAMVPRLCACVVRCVARAARGLSAHIRECVRHSEEFTDRVF
jgi:hypothetical protein